MDTREKIRGGGTERYIKPEMETVELSGENLITASCGSCGPADYDGYSMCLGVGGCSDCSDCSDNSCFEIF